MNSTLHMLAIAKKAGRLEIGEEPVGAAARAHQARLILTAEDAADNSIRRAAHFAEQGNVPWLQTTFTKGELGGIVGRASCAMLAVTDTGLACAVAGKLAAENPEQYGETARALEEKARKVLQRQAEQRAHEKKGRKLKHKPWVGDPMQPRAETEPFKPTKEFIRQWRLPKGIVKVNQKKKEP